MTHKSKCTRAMLSALDLLAEKIQVAKRSFDFIENHGIAKSQTSAEIFAETVFIDIPKILNHIELYWDMTNAFPEPKEQSE